MPRLKAGNLGVGDSLQERVAFICVYSTFWSVCGASQHHFLRLIASREVACIHGG